MTALRHDFSAVTEVPAGRATREQLSMIRTRYAEAARRGKGRRILEVACGSGRGLGLLARDGAFIAGGDITFPLLQLSRQHYGARANLLQMDAQQLPFKSASFDLIVCFEAVYYLPDAPLFVRECRRVLRSGGEVLISSVNPEWSGSSPSPMSHRYYSGAELAALLRREGFDAELWGAFRVDAGGAAAELIALLRRLAVRLRLFPRSLGGRETLKRLFYGRLTPLGPEVGEAGEIEPLVPLGADRSAPDFKILYAAGTVPPQGDSSRVQ